MSDNNEWDNFKGTMLIMLDSFFMPILYMAIGALIYKWS
jgi:hypothetical protein